MCHRFLPIDRYNRYQSNQIYRFLSIYRLINRYRFLSIDNSWRRSFFFFFALPLIWLLLISVNGKTQTTKAKCAFNWWRPIPSKSIHWQDAMQSSWYSWFLQRVLFQSWHFADRRSYGTEDSVSLASLWRSFDGGCHLPCKSCLTAAENTFQNRRAGLDSFLHHCNHTVWFRTCLILIWRSYTCINVRREGACWSGLCQIKTLILQKTILQL